MKEDIVLDYPVALEEADYETERGKPVPNRIHGTVQAKLTVLLDRYSDRFDFATEVALATTPPTTPDICI